MNIVQKLSPLSCDLVPSPKRNLRATLMEIATCTAITASSNRLKGDEVLTLGSIDLRDQNSKE